MKIYFHPNQLLHNPKSYFSRGKMRAPQEKPERMHEITTALERNQYAISQPNDFGIDPLVKAHTLGFIDFLKNAYQEWQSLDEDWGDEVMSNIFVSDGPSEVGILAKAAKYLADGSCPIGQGTWESIYWSAQTALACADDLLNNKRLSLGLTRPAGHHARKHRAGGFCYVNNAAVIAEYLIEQSENFKKIAIFDTDMHHGQGVQEIFYERNDILYASVHGDTTNFYPVVAGFPNEKGKGNGYGYNLNLPMPHGSSRDVFFDRVEQAISYIEVYNPDVLIHILGFDVYYQDPQAKCHLETKDFEYLAQRILALGIPTIILVEGGYCIERLGDNMMSFMKGLKV